MLTLICIKSFGGASDDHTTIRVVAGGIQQSRVIFHGKLAPVGKLDDAILAELGELAADRFKRQAKVAGEMTPGREAPNVADETHKCSGREKTDTGDRAHIDLDHRMGRQTGVEGRAYVLACPVDHLEHLVVDPSIAGHQ